MNAERPHAVANAIKIDLSKSNIVSHLQQLVSALQNQINQPGQPQYQQQVSQFYEVLQAALRTAAVNDFSPAWRQMLEELGAAGLLGSELEGKIAEIFARNQITPSVANQELQQLLTNLQAFSNSIDQLVVAFRQLQIGSEELERGECEVGILVPRVFVNNRLDKFSDELNELNQILGVFAELATSSRPGFNIRTISSTDLSVFLEAIPVVGACIAVAVERIIGLYKQLLEIRKLQGDLAKQGLEKKNLKGIEDHANGLMEKGIDALVKELLAEFHKKEDQGRANELSIELKFALKKIANRVDRGFNIEVRMEEPESTPEDGSTDGQPTGSDAAKNHARIQAASKGLQFLKLDGDPILSLPEEKADRPKKSQ